MNQYCKNIGNQCNQNITYENVVGIPFFSIFSTFIWITCCTVKLHADIPVFHIRTVYPTWRWHNRRWGKISHFISGLWKIICAWWPPFSGVWQILRHYSPSISASVLRGLSSRSTAIIYSMCATTVILIPKPDKDPLDCASYPVLLLNVDYKILRRVRATRLNSNHSIYNKWRSNCFFAR